MSWMGLFSKYFLYIFIFLYISNDHISPVRLQHVLDGGARMEGGTLRGPDAEGASLTKIPILVFCCLCLPISFFAGGGAGEEPEQVHTGEPAEAAAAGLSQPGAGEAETQGRKPNSMYSISFGRCLLLCLCYFSERQDG